MSILTRTRTSTVNQTAVDSGAPKDYQILEGNPAYNDGVVIDVQLSDPTATGVVRVWIYDEVLAIWGILMDLVFPGSANPNYLIPFAVKTFGQRIAITVPTFAGPGNFNVTAALVSKLLTGNINYSIGSPTVGGTTIEVITGTFTAGVDYIDKTITDGTHKVVAASSFTVAGIVDPLASTSAAIISDTVLRVYSSAGVAETGRTFVVILAPNPLG